MGHHLRGYVPQLPPPPSMPPLVAIAVAVPRLVSPRNGSRQGDDSGGGGMGARAADRDARTCGDRGGGLEGMPAHPWS